MKIILNAYNNHNGGGKVLLGQVLDAIDELGYTCSCYVDTRYIIKRDYRQISFTAVDHNILSRVRAEIMISNESSGCEFLLSLTNLPPLMKVNCPVFIFLQNLYLIDTSVKVSLNLKIRLRLLVERFWFLFFKSKNYSYVVQTETMKQKLIKLLGDEYSIHKKGFFNFPEKRLSEKKREGFLYVASIYPHKNHMNLLKAWSLLKENSFNEKLILVIDRVLPEGMREFIEKNEINVEILQDLSHQQVLELYMSSRVLIFPSLFESFGLPLLEAAALGLPVLASNANYVKDIIVPTQLFDPLDPKSIKEAVLGLSDIPLPASSCGKVVSSVRFMCFLAEITKSNEVLK